MKAIPWKVTFFVGQIDGHPADNSQMTNAIDTTTADSPTAYNDS